MLDMFLPWYVISAAVNTITTKSGFSGVLKYCSNIGFQYFFLVATSSWTFPFALISTYGSENSLPDQMESAVSGFFFSCSTFFEDFIVAPTRVMSGKPASTMNRTAGSLPSSVATAATWGPPITSMICSLSGMEGILTYININILFFAPLRQVH